MGIDARILIKNFGKHLTKEEVFALGVQMARVVGPGHFYIDPFGIGLYKEKTHAITLIEPMTEEYAEEYEIPQHVGKAVYFQDGPEIVSKGEQFFKVHISDRYYGSGYERGSWPTIRSILEWIMYNLPDMEIWYGGDSSGVCAEHVTQSFIQKMNLHYYGVGREPYVHAFSRGQQRVCPGCHVPLAGTGGGSDREFYWCDACGSNFVYHGNSSDKPVGFYLCKPTNSVLGQYDELAYKIVGNDLIKL